MRLLEALQAARYTVTANKADTVRRHVCLEFNAERRLVTAHDGAVTTQYVLTQEGLPEMLTCVSIDQVAPAIAHAEDVAMDWVSGGAAVGLRLTNAGNHQAHATINVMPATQFKAHAIPDAGAEVWPAPKAAVTAMASFVSQDPSAPQFQYIQASELGLAATDMGSAACLFLTTPWKGLLAPSLFKHWPTSRSARMMAAASGSGALIEFVAADGAVSQRRYTHYTKLSKTQPVPPVWERLAPASEWTDPYSVAELKPLSAALKQATGCSDQGLVWISHDEAGVSIRANTEAGGHVFQTTLPGIAGESRSRTPCCFDGKRLLAALKPVATPTVLLALPHENAPLRIEAGRFVACVWRIEVAPEAAHP